MWCPKISSMSSFVNTSPVFVEPGTVGFKKRGYVVKESCGKAVLDVQRKNGADGKVSVKWRTIEGSAIRTKDYLEEMGELTFEHGEVSL